MVSYLHVEGPSRGPQATNVAEGSKPIKGLVCSPDLSAVFSAPGAEPLPSVAEEKQQSLRCMLCHKDFDQKSAYQSHMRNHGKEGEDPYRCDICSKSFAVPARLTRHYRTHTGEKPYQCEYCSKSFSVKENLSVHRRIHTKERPYKCDICERAFEHSGKLHRHMRIHTGERPHKCSVCDKTFIQSGQLVIHMRTHTGEKPYICKICNKGFTCSKQLKVHTRTHTGEKPYSCDICGKCFGYNHVLKLHQVAHFGAKVYKCTLCHETFNSKKTMELHIKGHPEQVSGSRDSPSRASPPVVDMSHIYNKVPKVVTNPAFPNAFNEKESCKTDELMGQLAVPTPVVAPASSVGYAQEPPVWPYFVYQRNESPYPVGPPFPALSTQRNVSHKLLSVAVAAASAANGVDERVYQPSSPVSLVQSPESCHSYSYQDQVSMAYTNNHYIPNLDNSCSSFLDLPGNDARRRVEAALEFVDVEEERKRSQQQQSDRITCQPMLTPPSSNPSSPVADSPDPLDLALPHRETLILPPRKRSKMILESMAIEKSNRDAFAQRQSSVIQFARATSF